MSLLLTLAGPRAANTFQCVLLTKCDTHNICGRRHESLQSVIQRLETERVRRCAPNCITISDLYLFCYVEEEKNVDLQPARSSLLGETETALALSHYAHTVFACVLVS